MPRLVGKHPKKIDSKGRVSVPKQFRDALMNGDAAAGDIYAISHFQYPAIWVFGENVMDQITEGLGEFDLFSAERNDMASVLLASAHTMTFDAEGRTVLPPDMLTDTQISSEVVFIGQGQHFEMWNPAVFEAHRAEAVARLRAKGAALPKRRREGVQ
jgi:MraZ protein